MTNAFLKLKTLHGDIVRISVDKIISYKSEGSFGTQLLMLGNEQYYLEITAEELDAAIKECYCMLKDVNHYEPLPEVIPYVPEQTVVFTDSNKSEQTPILPEHCANKCDPPCCTV